MKMKDREIELLKDVQVRHESKVKWTISNFAKMFMPKVTGRLPLF